MAYSTHHGRGPGGKPAFQKIGKFIGQHDRSSVFDSVGWALFFIWVGVAWLLRLGLGWNIVGVGVLIVGMQFARLLFHARVESFWFVVGAALLIGGFWELSSVALPLAPFLLIALGIVLLVWYLMRTLSGRTRMF